MPKHPINDLGDQVWAVAKRLPVGDIARELKDVSSTLHEIATRAGPLEEGVGVRGDLFGSIHVLYVFQGSEGPLIGVWYHPNQEACEHEKVRLRSISSTWSSFDFEIVEYEKKA